LIGLARQQNTATKAAPAPVVALGQHRRSADERNH
jgi:hypothetical protein